MVKYELLSEQKNECNPRRNAGNRVINLSDRILTDDERSVLERGVNYSIPNTKTRVPAFIATVKMQLVTPGISIVKTK